MENYTKRKIEKISVRSIDGRDLTLSTGWGCYAPENVAPLLSDGKEFFIEYYGFNTISGWLIDGTWYNHKSDEDFARDMEDLRRTFHNEKVWDLETHREDWKKRTDALPDWIRARIEHFKEVAGPKFDLDGWGYELVVAEMAVMFDENGLEEPENFSEYSIANGVSGNQYDMAKALAKLKSQQPEFDFGNTVSALSPLTGSADYS